MPPGIRRPGTPPEFQDTRDIRSRSRPHPRRTPLRVCQWPRSATTVPRHATGTPLRSADAWTVQSKPPRVGCPDGQRPSLASHSALAEPRPATHARPYLWRHSPCRATRGVGSRECVVAEERDFPPGRRSIDPIRPECPNRWSDPIPECDRPSSLGTAPAIRTERPRHQSRPRMADDAPAGCLRKAPPPQVRATESPREGQQHNARRDHRVRAGHSCLA